MNEVQQEALNMAFWGHSFFLTGDAGTGKTFTVTKIISHLRKHGNRVLVTSSTGISCTPLSESGAQTVHNTFGLKDGRYSADQLKMLFADYSDSYYSSRRKMIKEADVLIVDEISMISERTLGLVDVVCRDIRDPMKPMGGLQCIFVGDFFQLPPVPNQMVQDPGRYCFCHSHFKKMVPHTIRLVEVNVYCIN